MADVHQESSSMVSFPSASIDEESSGTFAWRFEDDGEGTKYSASNGDNPDGLRPILTDEESRKLLTEHKKYLKLLVAEGHKDLQSMGFSRSSQASLRSIITEKLDRSMMSVQKLEADITEATEDLTDFSEHQFDGHLAFDFDEQQRALDISRNSQAQRRRDEVADNDEEDDDGSFALPAELCHSRAVPATNRKIPVSPDVYVPLRGATETWQAIRRGCTTATTCSDCNSDLHVIEDAEYFVCPDCWMVGPIEQSVGGIALEFDGSSDNYGLGLGVKARDVIQWVVDGTSKTQIA